MHNKASAVTTAIIIVLALIIIGGGVWYFVLNKSPEYQFKDWKTYRNEEYGFEFKYPSNFSLKESSSIDLNTVSIDLGSPKLDGGIIVNNPGLGWPLIINSSKIHINIGGIATEYTIGDRDPGMIGPNTMKTIALSFVQDENGYSMVFNFDKSNLEQEQIVKDIFSTFKFIP